MTSICFKRLFKGVLRISISFLKKCCFKAFLKSRLRASLSHFKVVYGCFIKASLREPYRFKAV